MRWSLVCLVLALSCSAAERREGSWSKPEPFSMNFETYPQDEAGNPIDCSNETFSFAGETTKLELLDLVVHPSSPKIILDASRAAGVDPEKADALIRNHDHWDQPTWKLADLMVSRDGSVVLVLPRMRCHGVVLLAQDLAGRLWRLFLPPNKDRIVCGQPNGAGPLEDVTDYDYYEEPSHCPDTRKWLF